ncbi:hypothetical protein SCLCIDRAFT_1207194 [Scleroderma citrinum Foug A]|uniref:Uncharacterized protein n=1 Tax=Scleroderma citrinum Foug A TaxID=1036808 RepID=A0A0C3AY85_9AGAM|nr:hypothetical protein SCLCIDRAFT_1207194 [Scleroderma citrinum Foug A]
MIYHVGVFCGGRWCKHYDANEKTDLIDFLISPAALFYSQMSVGTEERPDVSEGLVHGKKCLEPR